MMRAKDRRSLGMLIIGLYITAYIFAAASIGSLFADRVWWQQILYFAIAGTIWPLPLKPLMDWMAKPDPDGV
jgi:TRAP-type uncharacterized transport system fused permease subunit